MCPMSYGMLLTPLKPRRAKVANKKTVRFPGIVEIAREMGVRRETLWKYLTGYWPMSAKTRSRYERAKAKVERARKKGAA